VRLAHLKDESILHYYENIRTQVEMERGLPHKSVSGNSVRKYAAELREELTRRRLHHTPIDWHSDE
jgi:hypothetical protein